MSFQVLSILSLVLAGATALFGALWMLGRVQITASAREIERLKQQAEDWRLAAEKHARESAADEARSEAEIKGLNEKIASLENIREKLEKDFQALAAKALNENNDQFLKLAKETFESHKKDLTADNEKSRRAFAEMVKPINDTLKTYDERLATFDKERATSTIELTHLIKQVEAGQSQVRSETARLTNALRAAPKTRGRWGEETLRNVMELAGMVEHADFVTEEHFVRGGEGLRPDVILNLPGERVLVVDAKTSMDAYLAALEATDDAEKEDHLVRHAEQIRTHMLNLAKKEYAVGLKLRDGRTLTPDFVVMFVPGENLFSAAIERRPDLFDEAIKKNVIITTPTTFIALAKAIVYGWQQEKVKENAHKIAELGKELYSRLSTMGGHLSALHKSLDGTVKKYNALVGSVEGSVLTQARKFEELDVRIPGKDIPEIEFIESDPRAPNREKYLELEATPILPSQDEATEISADEADSTIEPGKAAGNP